MRCASFLLLVLLLAGCDKLTGAADQKIADAEAVGFACRVSGKTPEACMKENEAQSPSSVLDGWKTADEDIRSGKLDPSMSNTKSSGGEAAAEKPAKEAADVLGRASCGDACNSPCFILCYSTLMRRLLLVLPLAWPPFSMARLTSLRSDSMPPKSNHSPGRA